MKNFKHIFYIIVAFILYTLILTGFGIFGSYIQTIIIYYGKYVLKYGLIAFGYFLTIFIPIRIVNQYKKNKEIEKQYRDEQKLQNIQKKQKDLEEKILLEMYKSSENN